MRELSAKLTEGEKPCPANLGRVISAATVIKNPSSTIFDGPPPPPRR